MEFNFTAITEAMFRMTFGELYMFQKSLAETGHTELAEALPVQTVSLVSQDALDETCLACKLQH